MDLSHEEHVRVPGGHVWTVTKGVGVPLVLCHGGPGGSDYLAPVSEMLEDLAEVHRFDQRGGGRSLVGRPWTVARLVEDMEVLRRHWGHNRWVVGGHSWGAHLALFYAQSHPARTRGLILLSGTGVRWGWGAERKANRLPRLTPSERAEVQALERCLEAGEDESARSRLRALMWLTDFADRATAERAAQLPSGQPDTELLRSLERDWERRLAGFEADLKGVRAPALVVHGEADPIGESGPRALARLLPNARFVVLDRVGHYPWIEDRTGLQRQLRRFLEEAKGEP